MSPRNFHFSEFLFQVQGRGARVSDELSFGALGAWVYRFNDELSFGVGVGVMTINFEYIITLFLKVS